MKKRESYILFLVILFFTSSCTVMEKSSMHGFESGYYQMKTENKLLEKVYVDITDEKITVYPVYQNHIVKKEMISIPQITSDTTNEKTLKFIKKDIDIDITSILLKYRPSVYHLPAQLNTEFNAAIYAGWRHDQYRVISKLNPLGKQQYKIINRGYDFGLFAGPATSSIGPFSTRNAITNEYSGFVIQFGVAGFIESNVASFGLATGFDHLLSPDRKDWIYHQKPWIGFIIGIALN